MTDMLRERLRRVGERIGRRPPRPPHMGGAVPAF